MLAELIKPGVKAIILGKELTEIPEDLFVPPDALEILLDSFSGPLDLLLYLIKKQNIDILDIPIVSITQQYLLYIRCMEERRMELAAEYLLMAAMLAEIKSRFLLPLETSLEEEEEDPRTVLVRRLQAYEQIKKAAENISNLPRFERDLFAVQIQPEIVEERIVYPELTLSQLAAAIESLLVREEHFSDHLITSEPLSVKERMSEILLLLKNNNFIEFKHFLKAEEGRAGLIVSLLAILELARQSLLTLTQTQSYAPLYIQAATNG